MARGGSYLLTGRRFSLRFAASQPQANRLEIEVRSTKTQLNSVTAEAQQASAELEEAKKVRQGGAGTR